MYNAGELKKGLKIQIDKEPYVIIDFQFVKPGKGQALYRCKMRNMITGVILDRTYRSGDVFESADLEQRKMQYLYSQDNQFYFMDSQNYEQSVLGEEQVGDAKNYLIDNLEVDILLFDGRPIGSHFPISWTSSSSRPILGRKGIRSPATSNPSPWRQGIPSVYPLCRGRNQDHRDTRTGNMSPGSSHSISTDERWRLAAKRQTAPPSRKDCPDHTTFLHRSRIPGGRNPHLIPAPAPETHIDAIAAGDLFLQTSRSSA